MRATTLLRAAAAVAWRAPSAAVTRAVLPSTSTLSTRALGAKLAQLQIGGVRQASTDAEAAEVEADAGVEGIPTVKTPRKATGAKKSGVKKTKKAKVAKKPKLRPWEALGPDGKKLPLPFDSKPTKRSPFIVFVGSQIAKHKNDPEWQKESRTDPSKQVLDFVKLTKNAGEQWHKLSDAEKQPYVEESQRDRAEYERKLKQWQDGLTTEDIRRQNAWLRHQRSKGKKGTALLVDQKKPKRPLSGFFRFLSEFRAAQPDDKPVRELASAAGEKWKSLSAEERQPYEQQAQQAWDQYRREFAAYKSAQE